MLGGALGSGARVWLNQLVESRLGPTFPWGTLMINILGSFLIGLSAALLAPEGRWPGSPDLRAFIGWGILGGFTTFSSFSLQTVTLAQSGQTGLALGYVAASVLLCVLGAWLGLTLGSR